MQLMYFINWGSDWSGMIWNDIISMNSIGNQRKQWYQLHGIGCNSCISSIGGGAIDLEWQYLIQFNWESKETIGCNSWWTSSTIGRATDLEWYYLFQFNWEWRKETMVSITWNRMQLMYFINWESNSRMQLMYFINWLGEQLIWNEIISFNSIGNERN